MKPGNVIKTFSVYILLLGTVSVGFSGNIDPYEDGSQYAYGENVGWLNFEFNPDDIDDEVVKRKY